MSREQSLRAPASPEAESPPSGSGGALALRIEAVARQLPEAFGGHRHDLIETLNALLEGLPATTRPEEAAPTRPHPNAPTRPPWNKVVDPLLGVWDRVRDAATGRRTTEPR